MRKSISWKTPNSKSFQQREKRYAEPSTMDTTATLSANSSSRKPDKNTMKHIPTRRSEHSMTICSPWARLRLECSTASFSPNRKRTRNPEQIHPLLSHGVNHQKPDSTL